MRLNWLDRFASWLNLRRNYGRRCATHDLDDFPEITTRHPDCTWCTCGRCPCCVAWDEHDKIFGNSA